MRQEFTDRGHGHRLVPSASTPRKIAEEIKTYCVDACGQVLVEDKMFCMCGYVQKSNKAQKYYIIGYEGGEYKTLTPSSFLSAALVIPNAAEVFQEVKGFKFMRFLGYALNDEKMRKATFGWTKI